VIYGRVNATMAGFLPRTTSSPTTYCSTNECSMLICDRELAQYVTSSRDSVIPHCYSCFRLYTQKYGILTCCLYQCIATKPVSVQAHCILIRIWYYNEISGTDCTTFSYCISSCKKQK